MKPENLEAIYRLSPVQEGILFHALYEPEQGLYVLQLVCRLDGPLDVESLKRAWALVLERHAVLRTSFHWEDVTHPVQVVARRVDLPWHEEDWRSLSAVEQESALEALRRADLDRGFDLAEPPLVRLALVRTAEEVHELIWSFHHLLVDGWSLPLIFKEVFSTYAALCAGRRHEAGRARPYRDFIGWLQQRDGAAAEAFWRNSLAGFSAPTPLAVDRSRGAVAETGRGTYQEHGIELPEETTAALAAAAKRQGLTVNNLLQGAWALLLSRYSGEGEVVFGTTLSGRSAPLPGIESMVGLFINTLPLRVEVTPEAPLSAWLKGLQDVHGEVLQHEHTSLVDVQGWSGVPRGLPLFESILVFENYPLERAVDAQLLSELPFRVQVRRGVDPLNYPLALIAFDGDRLALRLSVETARIETATALRMLGHLRSLLAGMSEGGAAALAELPLLAVSERHQLRYEWNDTAGEVRAVRCAHELIERQAVRSPEQVAVSCGGEALTYGDLDRRANQVARALRRRGAGPGVLVGLCVERSLDLVVSLLAIFKAGAAYLPLDPAYPRERLAFLLEDSGAAALVAQERVLDRVPEWRGQRLLLDAEGAEIDRESTAALAAAGGEDSLAYVIYTSGSTGRPKGVLVEHGNLVSTLQASCRELGWQPGDRIPCVAPYSFDIFLFELLSPLATGGTAELVSLHPVLDIQALAAMVAGATHFHAVPALMRQLVAAVSEGEVACPRLRTLFVGGDAVPADLLVAMRET
ncbi:MAG TPA: condensation domain-containing protein, partial [Thermoanaerobaculia bacterium]